MFNKLEQFIRDQYRVKSNPISLHEPRFSGNEKKYINNAIDSTFVSSVGEYVTRLEEDFKKYVKSEAAVVTVNGTAALHVALQLLGVKAGDLVLTQALTFVATANAIKYIGADPVFLDSSSDNMALCPLAVQNFLQEHCELREDGAYHKKTQKRVAACVPMHVFGHPAKISELLAVCAKWKVPVLEDAAESLGSLYHGQHTGTFSPIGVFSFNGNKIMTAGGGGMMVFADEKLGRRGKHITTTAKRPHPYEFYHDEIGYNYRMPNLNAALALAQLERVEEFVENKRETAHRYQEFFKGSEFEFIVEPAECRSNYWLNAIRVGNFEERNQFLKEMNQRGIMCRPIWALMNELPMYASCLRDEVKNAKSFADTVVNLPSSVRES